MELIVRLGLLYLKQVNCLGKQRVGHTGEDASVCFLAEALSKHPTRKVAHSPHYPIDVAIIILSHFSLVSYTTSHMLEGESSFATKYKTQPQNSQALASASRMM